MSILLNSTFFPTFDHEFTTGHVIGTWAAWVLLAICILFAVSCIGWWPGFAGGLVVSAIIAGSFLGSMFPYEKEYHAYLPHEGVVTAVSSRLLPSGGEGAMEQKYVVVFEGSNQEYGCRDTRCSLIQPGDYVRLRCIRDWDYNGSDGYDCKWGERFPAGTNPGGSA